jgi:hypothetical protein
MRDAVRKEAPGRGVSLRREEVAPVLADEPHADDGRYLCRASELPELGEPAGDEHGDDAEAEYELVDAETAEVHTRAEPMPFEAQHGVNVARAG